MSRKSTKITERNFVNKIVDRIIIPRFGGRHHLRGEIGKLRRMSFKQILRWMSTRAILSSKERKGLIKKYNQTVKTKGVGK